MPSAKAPKQTRRPWRSGSSASNRVARRAAWMPQALRRGAVIHRHEDRRLAFAGQGRGQIGAPHLVHALGAVRAVVGLRAMRPADPAWRQRVGGPASAAGRDAWRCESRRSAIGPDLAVALTVERAIGQQLLAGGLPRPAPRRASGQRAGPRRRRRLGSSQRR